MTDILNSIDDAISERCACPCNEPIPPDGPSAWFASQACQWRWNQRQASNPAEVYNGPSVAMLQAAEQEAIRHAVRERAAPPAGPMRVTASHGMAWIAAVGTTPADPGAWTPLGDIGDVMLVGHGAPRTPAVIRRPDPQPHVRGDHRHLINQAGWTTATSGPLAWIRRCRGCGNPVTPVDALPNQPAVLCRESDPPSVSLPTAEDIRNTCPRCHEPFPGPRMLAQCREPDETYGPTATIRLASGGDYVTWRMVPELVDEPFAMETLWENAERALLDAMTWRDPCSADGCTEKARALFTVNRPVAFAGQSWRPGGIGLCPEHKSHLLRAVDIATGRMLLHTTWSAR